MEHTIHSPFLQSQPPQWDTLETRCTGHDYSVFRPRSWKLVAAIHGNEFHHGFDCEVSSKGGARKKTRWEKRFVRARVEKTFAHEAHTHLGKLHPFLGILISHRWSFPAWNHPAQPETCISLPHAYHPVKTQAEIVLLVGWLWVLDLKQDSSKWTKGKCIQCSLTAWRLGFQTGNEKTEESYVNTEKRRWDGKGFW